MMLKTVFMGTPPIVLPTLKALHIHSDLQAVFTAPDKPAKRGKKIQAPIPALWARENHIPCFQPPTLRDDSVALTLKGLQPDLLVVYAYGYLLPQRLLDIPRLAPINYHCSLLPKYRGASPIQSALLHGERETGLSVQRMIKRLDAGPLVFSTSISIEEEDHSPSLTQKMAELAGTITPRLLEAYQMGKICETEQAEDLATFCGKIAKEDGVIQWSQSALQIQNQVRAFFDWPGSTTCIQGKIIKVLRAKAVHYQEDVEGVLTRNESNRVPGEILLANKKHWFIQTGSGVLSLLVVQPENKKPMDFTSFLNGYPITLGTICSAPEKITYENE